jgi:hypothetical protein
MKIWISGETKDDVEEGFRPARNDVDQTLNAALADRNYGPAVEKWALIPIILPFEDERWGEIRKYHKRRKVVEFRLKINHTKFKAATPARQRALICACLLRSIDLFPLLKVNGFDYQTFRGDLEGVTSEKGWLDKSLRAEEGIDQTMEKLARHRIAISSQFGGPDAEASKIASAIKLIKEAAAVLQGDFIEGSGPAIKVIFCIPGRNAQTDWHHGRISKYLKEQKRLVIEVGVPQGVVESDFPFDYLLLELHGANAIAFHFYEEQERLEYPLRQTEELVERIRKIVIRGEPNESSQGD